MVIGTYDVATCLLHAWLVGPISRSVGDAVLPDQVGTLIVITPPGVPRRPTDSITAPVQEGEEKQKKIHAFFSSRVSANEGPPSLLIR